MHQRTASDPADGDNYGTKLDGMKEETKAFHVTYEDNRVNGIHQQEQEDSWRNKTNYPEKITGLYQRSNPTDADTYGTRFGNLKADLQS